MSEFAGSGPGIAILRETALQNVDLSDVELEHDVDPRVGCEEAGA